MTGHQQPPEPIHSLTQRIDLDFVLQAAGLGVWEYDPVSNQVRWDARCRALFGLAADNPMSYEQAFAHVHPDDVARVDQAAQRVMNPQSGGVFDQTYRTIGVDDGQLRWVRFQGKVYFTPTGEVARFGGVAQEVTEQMGAQQALENSRQQVLNSFELAPFAVAVLTGPQLTYLMTNALYCQLIDRPAEQLLGKPITEVVPEVKGQGFVELLHQVMATGLPYQARQTAFQVPLQNGMRTAYFDFTYQPWQEDGQVIGVMIAATEVTQQVLAQQLLEESRAQLRSVIEEAPFAMGLHVGSDLRIELANDTQLSYWGRDRSVMGQPFRQILPELEGQGFFELFEQAYATGQSYQGQAAPVRLSLNGQLDTYYFDYFFKPLRNKQGQVYAVLNTAINVTPQVLARQQLEEKETALRNAVELAELGTWTLDIASGDTYLSPHHAVMFGLSTTLMPYETALAIVHPGDRKRVRAAFEQALQPGSHGLYEAEYRIINATSGQQQVIRAKGEIIRDAQGHPLRIAGMCQDVTLERESQLVLEELVQQRTQQLATTNEALTVSNERFVSANQSLEQANADLTRSNQNLEQFAYIASHDLQEPLRKIQQFGDLLKTRFTDSIEGQELVYLDRMQLAAVRMSVLIKDLLAFSRISTTQVIAQPVRLNEVIHDVLETLSVAIEESAAQIEVADLPTVQGERLQLSQLFQNLLENALKFHRISSAGAVVRPQITVRARRLAKDDLPPSATPTRDADAYHLIEVIDDGIGFEEKYLDRIFQVFQRLHGKNEFAGTGIGLAIVQKVVTNHGGAITASSKPNQGATFSVYLPAQ